jgi:hypothetical protein
LNNGIKFKGSELERYIFAKKICMVEQKCLKRGNERVMPFVSNSVEKLASRWCVLPIHNVN